MFFHAAMWRTLAPGALLESIGVLARILVAKVAMAQGICMTGMDKGNRWQVRRDDK